MNTLCLRKYYGLTQQDLSDMFGISLRTIQGWDSRDCMPSYIDYMMESILHENVYHLYIENPADPAQAWAEACSEARDLLKKRYRIICEES